MNRTTFRILLAFLIVAATAVESRAAEAQDSPLLGGGLDLHLFRPALDSKGMLTVNGTDILGAGDPSFGLVLDAGFGILPFAGFVDDETQTAENAERVDRVVDQFFTGTLHFNYGIANRMVVGLQLPIQVASGPNLSIPGAYNDGARPQGLDHQGIGDLVVHGKIRLLRAERDPVGVAATLAIGLPTGDEQSFAGETGVSIWPSLAVEYRPVRELRFAINVGYRLALGEGSAIPIGGRTIPGNANATDAIFAPGMEGTQLGYDDVVTFGAGVSWRIAPAVDVLAEVYGNQIVSEIGTEQALAAEAMGGLKIFVERNSYLVLAGGAGLGGFSAADVRGMIGFVFEPSIGDRDGDGLRDDIDQCPDEPEDFDDFADEDGCPEPDNDRDGILDVDDECPLVPEDRDGDADEDGCPEGGEGDRDGDGIQDEADQCPDDPEDRDGFQDEEGCPDPDNDEDSLLDQDDLCPNDPEDRDSWSDEDGCPDPDNDEDRILDVSDECDNDPEMYNGYQDEDGCPDRGILEVTTDGFTLFENIYFETDSARIQGRSFPVLDAVAAAMQGNPNLTLVEIQGHADERATDEYNIQLTRDRAASVLAAVVERGVDPRRLRSAGYGERCPLDPRHNANAWERNRRVEFKILRTDAGPTDVEIACPAGRELIPE